MTPWRGLRTVAIVTACLNAAGCPDLVLTEIDLTHADYADGVHCERIEARLGAAGYQKPFLHFDHGPVARWLAVAMRQHGATSGYLPVPRAA